jgi:hypothetical protein
LPIAHKNKLTHQGAIIKSSAIDVLPLLLITYILSGHKRVKDENPSHNNAGMAEAYRWHHQGGLIDHIWYRYKLLFLVFLR